MVCNSNIKVLCSIHHPDDKSLWEQMTTIKHNILQRWDAAPHPVKICCIKFVQKVVHVQTPGTIADPRVCCSREIYLLSQLLTHSSDRSKTKPPCPSSPETMLSLRYRIWKQKRPVCWIGS